MSGNSDSNWTLVHESILKEWKAKAFAYLWLQNNSCYHYIKLYNWLAYIIIIFSSLASATMFSLNSSSDKCESQLGIPIVVIQYVVGVISLVSAILTGVIRQLKPGEMYQQHASMSKRYHTLMRSIDACLSLTSQLRPNPAIFIEKAGAELDNLANNQLDPPLAIIKKFEKIYGPLERILYGEDVVELWKLRYHTSKIEQKMKKTFNPRISKDENEESIGTKDYDDDTVVEEVYKSKLYRSAPALQNVVITPNTDVTQLEVEQSTEGDNCAFMMSNFNIPLKTSEMRAATFKST